MSGSGERASGESLSIRREGKEFEGGRRKEEGGGNSAGVRTPRPRYLTSTLDTTSMLSDQKIPQLYSRPCIEIRPEEAAAMWDSRPLKTQTTSLFKLIVFVVKHTVTCARFL